MNTYRFSKHELEMLDELSKKGTILGKRYNNKMDYLKDLIYMVHYENIEKGRHQFK